MTQIDKALVKLLERLEWSGKGYTRKRCPICRGTKGIGHTYDCELKRELMRLRSLND